MGHAWSRPRRALVAGLFTAAPTGSFYGFSVYSQALKKQFGLSQQQLANINTIPYAFGFVGPAAGWVTYACGPGVATLIGGVVQTTGQVSMFLVATKSVDVPNPPWALVGTAMTTFTGMMLNSGAAFTTPVQHYPRQRASAAALVKSFVGISGAAVTQAFVTLYGSPGADPQALVCLLMWASITLSCCLFSALIVPRRPSASDREPVHLLKILFAMISFLGFFATTVSLLPDGSLHDIGVATIAVLIFALIPVSFAPCIDAPSTAAASVHVAKHAHTSGGTHSGNHSGNRSDAADSAKHKLRGAVSSVVKEVHVANAFRTVTSDAHAERSKLAATPFAPVFESPESFTTSEMIRTPDAWLIWFVGVVVVGGGTVLATNMAQIVESAAAPDALVPTLVTLFSTGNLLGRLLCMSLSDAVVRSGRSRADFLVVICATMGVSHLGLLAAAAAAAPGSRAQSWLFIVSASGGGLSFGAVWPHFVVLASEIFGSQHLPKNYMFYDGTCGATGSLAFANLIPSAIYDAYATDNLCTGPYCFGTTHAIIAVLCAVSCGASLVVSARSAELYAQISASARAQKDAENAPENAVLL